MIKRFNIRVNGLHFFMKLSIFLILSGCTTLPTEPTIFCPIGNEVLLKDICKANNITWQWDSISQVVTLNLPDADAKILVGSDMVLIGDRAIYLDKPIKISNSTIVVPLDFERKIIGDASISSKIGGKYIFKKVRSVAIDAGHGGKDSGAIGRSGLYEKRVVLDIAKRVKKILERHKIEVVMTRDSDDFVTLKKRTELASEANVDIFVSIHANSSLSRSANGVEVYSLEALSRTEINEDQRKINAKIMNKQLIMEKSSPDLENIVADMLFVKKKPESDILAQYVVERISKNTKAKDRGKKESKFFVVRNTLMPAILVEVGFLSNPKEEKYFQNNSYRQKIAVGLSRGILDYANSQ